MVKARPSRIPAESTQSVTSAIVTIASPQASPPGTVTAGHELGRPIAVGSTSSLPSQVASVPPQAVALQGAALAAGSARLRARRLPIAASLVVAAAIATGLFAAAVRPLTVPVRLLPFYEPVPATALHVGLGYEEPSLVYYSDTFWRLGQPPTRAELREPILIVYRGAEYGLDRILAPDSRALRRDAVSACGATPGGQAARDSASRDTVDSRARAAGVPSFVRRSDLERSLVCGFNFARSTWTELVVFYREHPRRSPAR